MNVSNIRMKSTTVLLADGKRVSWFNVSHVLVEPTPDGVVGGYTFTIHWKYKASVKTETFTTPMLSIELNKYFARFGIVPLEKDLFINLAEIMIVTEEQLFGPVEKTIMSMVFRDGYEIKRKLESTKWSWWKQQYL